MALTVNEVPNSPREITGPPKVVLAALLSILLLAGVVALAGSLIPFELLHAKARGISSSGQIPFFTVEFYRGMQSRLRLIGVGNVALAIAGILFRRQLVDSIREILVDCRILISDVKSAVGLIPASDRVVLAGTVILAAALRFPLLWQPMRYDEAYTFLEYSSHPFFVALSFYNYPNNHLLNTLLVRLAYLVFGNQPWALRLPVFLAGIFLVPATYVAARSLYLSRGALLPAGLVASSSVLVEFSANARGYNFVCLAFLMLIPLAAYMLFNRNRAAWMLFAMVAALGFYAVPVMLYPFGGVVVWILLSSASGDGDSPTKIFIPLLISTCITIALTAELYSPVVAISGLKAVIANKWVVASPLPVFLRESPVFVKSTWRDWNRSIPPWLSWIFAVGFFLSFITNRRCGRFRVPLVAALVAWVVPVVLAQRVIPFARVWLFALPLYFITSSAGILSVVGAVFQSFQPQRAMTILALTVPIFLGFRVGSSHSASLANEARGLDAVAAYLKTELKPGDSVLACQPSDVPLIYYFQKEGLSSSVINVPAEGRTLVVVNGAVGDTLQQVLSQMKMENAAQSARLLTSHDSASLYEVIP